MRSFRHHPNQRRAIATPEPGFFKLRLVKGGWHVPCRLFHLARGWQAEVDGTLHEPHPDPALAVAVFRVWEGGIRIDEAEYRWLVDVRAYAEAHDPRHPAVNPHRPIDPLRLTPFYPTQPRIA